MISNLPDEFMQGIRVMYLIDRSVANTNRQSSRFVKKLISQNKEEYLENLEKLKAIRTQDERIYASVNSRNFKSATKQFKLRQLENEYMAEDQLFNFYRNLHNNWVSALTVPQSRASRYFLIDFDDNSIDQFLEFLKKNIQDKNIIFHYRTKKGHHIITNPFNPAIISNAYDGLNQFKLRWNWEIKKDGLLLLEF
jgi:hypothetical protein